MPLQVHSKLHSTNFNRCRSFRDQGNVIDKEGVIQLYIFSFASLQQCRNLKALSIDGLQTPYENHHRRPHDGLGEQNAWGGRGWVASTSHNRQNLKQSAVAEEKECVFHGQLWKKEKSTPLQEAWGNAALLLC